MAMTKQDYTNLGSEDFFANNPRKFVNSQSWQAQCIDLPYQNQEKKCKILPVHGGWTIEKENKRLVPMHIKRKTHARKIAEKLGYKVVV